MATTNKSLTDLEVAIILAPHKQELLHLMQGQRKPWNDLSVSEQHRHAEGMFHICRGMIHEVARTLGRNSSRSETTQARAPEHEASLTGDGTKQRRRGRQPGSRNKSSTAKPHVGAASAHSA